MSKIDLDEIEASLAYLEEWQKLIKELRAAREVVFRARCLSQYIHAIFLWRSKSHRSPWITQLNNMMR